MDLAKFKHSVFGNIRVIMQDGAPYFIGKEVASMLGYKDTDYAIRTHCKKQLTRGFAGSGQARKMVIIPESDLYRLVIKSKLPAAEKFEEWVMEEVLPAIRRNGGYIATTPEMSEEEIMARSVLLATRTIEQQRVELSDKTSHATKFTPTAIARLLPSTYSAQDLNTLLVRAGYQIRIRDNGYKYFLTEKGKRYGVELQSGNQNRILWTAAILDVPELAAPKQQP